MTARKQRDTFLQLLAFKENETSAEPGRLPSRIAHQNADYAAAEVEADIAAAVAKTRA